MTGRNSTWVKPMSLRRTRPASAPARGRSASGCPPRARASTSRGAPRRSTSGASSALRRARAAPSTRRRPTRSRGPRRPRRSRGGDLAAEGERVGLVDAGSRRSGSAMWYLYSAPVPTPGTKPSQIPELPRGAQRVAAAVPAVEVADHRDAARRWAPRPRSSVPATPSHGHGVRAELLVQARSGVPSLNR